MEQNLRGRQRSFTNVRHVDQLSLLTNSGIRTPHLSKKQCTRKKSRSPFKSTYDDHLHLYISTYHENIVTQQKRKPIKTHHK